MRLFKKISLPMQIVIALVLGVILGSILHGNKDVINYIQPIGDVFINLIKMIVVPIVFCSLALSISNVGDTKTIGRYGGKTLLYFVIMTSFAIFMGLVFGNLFKPGTGLNPDLLPKGDISKYEETAKGAEETTYGNHLIDTIVNIIPTNIFDALATGELLPIIFFSVFFGLALAAIGEKAAPVKDFLGGVLEAVFWMIGKVLLLAPLAVFAFITTTIITFGLSALIPLFKLCLTVVVAMFFFIFVVLGIVSRICGVKITQIIKLLKNDLMLAFSTASSEAVLPTVMRKMERFGVPRDIASFVLPTGYSFNLDGAAMYQSIAALFVAQLYGVDLSIPEQIILMVTLMLTSKGMAGVPGASIVVLLTTLGSVGLNPQGLALIIGVDRILEMLRTCVNVLGNSVASIYIAKTEGVYDKKEGQEYLKTI
ncbi:MULTISPECIES: cation:dicarboxylate symporter family transporter [Staphylococcus]|uniref:Proton sodium-glutamate symport protein n=3 Tax=Staphylococcus arlettae TaxID=29378 RepID=A0A380CLB9_9STAP|nr:MULTISPECIES: cation:dicarboxylase symporter family transporter [Staphylococcus]EJY95286.1 proton sodium-glutamate symport protein [Staphylococcus arlettae CVD059]ERF48950.1 proton/sodium-glutamate symport protein GltT [Staphylococcus sp. EGD-HP3]KAB2481019.1 cation:dicarboxylase symporter family transporter [Staphylococcus sp. CH99b_3]MCD8815406.1 cation:dicarboxylase symporter family transporter [Staphylococcus arlettae]MCD8839318.1 cation:dicarboxylase symporter family transporter [Staph